MIVMAEHTKPNQQTRSEEAPRPARTTSVIAAAHRKRLPKRTSNPLDPGVADHEKEMAERGANQQGEGRLP